MSMCFYNLIEFFFNYSLHCIAVNDFFRKNITRVSKTKQYCLTLVIFERKQLKNFHYLYNDCARRNKSAADGANIIYFEYIKNFEVWRFKMIGCNLTFAYHTEYSIYIVASHWIIGSFYLFLGSFVYNKTIWVMVYWGGHYSPNLIITLII